VDNSQKVKIQKYACVIKEIMEYAQLYELQINALKQKTLVEFQMEEPNMD